MVTNFHAGCLPVLIGSLPLDDHKQGVELVFKHTPEIPLWIQLPAYKEEGMISQFLPGFPGLTTEKDRTFIDTTGPSFDDDLLGFYEDYMAVQEGEIDLDGSRFTLTADTARGFLSFMERLKDLSDHPVAVKGQITGPITFGLGLTDQNKKAVFYDEQLKDAAVKLLAQKAGWQVRKLSSFGCPVIIFFDEPALAGFGSSAFISISRDEVVTCFEEVIKAVHDEGGLAGIHVCANADWSLILESAADIISFDAYSFFDRFVLYEEQIVNLFNSGRWLAWGMVPTLNVEEIQRETQDSILEQFYSKLERISSLGVERSLILNQSMITPSCGTGSLSLDLSKKVLSLTKKVSERSEPSTGSFP